MFQKKTLMRDLRSFLLMVKKLFKFAAMASTVVQTYYRITVTGDLSNFFWKERQGEFIIFPF